MSVRPSEPAAAPPRRAAARWHLIRLFAVLAIAAGLRFWGLHWSLPNELHQNSYHGGESRAVAVALQLDLASGDIEPRWRNKPYLRWGSLWFTTLHVANLVAEGAGLFEPPERIPDPASVSAGEEPPRMPRMTVQPDNQTFARAHLIARATSALLSLATVLVLGWLAYRAYGARSGWWTALGVALCPLLAYQARFATVNSSLAFACAVAIGLAARTARRATLGAVFATALAIGLAAAIKLAALPLVVPLGAALLIAEPTRPAHATPLRRRLRFVALGSLVGALGVALGFGLGMPYAYVHAHEFWLQFSDELANNRAGHGLVFVATGGGLEYLLTRSLPVSLGWPLAVVSACGVAWTAREAWRGVRTRAAGRPGPPGLPGAGDASGADEPRNPAPPSRALALDVVTLAWIAVNLFVLGTSHRRFLRYTLPMLPFLVLAGARWLARSAASERPLVRRAALGAALATALATLVYTAAAVRPFAAEDPRDACARWFHEHVPSGTSVALVKRPYSVTPPLFEEGAGPDGFPPDVPRYALEVLDADPARLATVQPEWVVLNRLELFYERRLGALFPEPEEREAQLAALDVPPEHRAYVERALAFQTALEAGYERAQSWELRASLFGLVLDWEDPPQGFSTPTQTVEAWRRRPSGS